MNGLAALNFRKMALFYIPLGVASCLVSVNNVIIDSTLGRGADAETIIAGYAIAASLLAITMNPLDRIRPITATYAKSREEFRAVAIFTSVQILLYMLVCLMLALSPVGPWVMKYLFNAADSVIEPGIANYILLMFVTIWMGIRSLFQGVLITDYQTRWISFSMITRVVVVATISLYLIQTGQVNMIRIGGWLFLIGFSVEASVTAWRGLKAYRKLPAHREQSESLTQKRLFSIYLPLLVYSMIQVTIAPIILSFLGKTSGGKLSVASYAVALGVTYLLIGFFSYMHQVAINFYDIDKSKTLRFISFINFIPALLIGILCYTPLGSIFLSSVMGLNENLQGAVLANLQIFMIYSLVYPWLDFCNGILMARGQTKVMYRSIPMNALITIITVIALVSWNPGWNGQIGAFAVSMGLVTELVIVFIAVRRFGAVGGFPNNRNKAASSV